MAAITEAVFTNALPWTMMLIGSGIILIIIFLNYVLKFRRYVNLSVLGVAIGMYLPLSSSFPLFIGGMIALLVQKRLQRRNSVKEEVTLRQQKGTLIACGLVAGSAIMDVVLAIPFSILQSPDALQLVGPDWKDIGVYLGVLSTFLLSWWIYRRVCR
jgi:uncharacterized oligopeptide transporter (OPT) family protein